MTLTLYVGSKRYSSWSLRPYLALAHARLPFETKTIFLDREDSKANIGKVSPSERVPVLHGDGVIVWDSLAICEYINELAPAARLWPEDQRERARARAISAEMHAGFVAMRRDMAMDIGGQRKGEGHTPDALADTRRVMAIWREALAASGGPFLFGREFTIADAMYAPVTTRFVTYGVEVDATSRAYIDTIAAFPPMQQWCADAAREPVSR